MTGERAQRLRLAWLPLAALAAALAITPLDVQLSRPFTDLLQRLAAPRAPPAGVLLVDIDSAALDELRPVLGPWPYGRDVYALVVEQLRDAGARAVVLNLLLADSRDGDTALARAIDRPGAPVVLAAAGVQPEPAPAAAAPPAAGAALPAQAWQAFVLPAASLWPATGRAPALGVNTTPLDDDGRLRRLPLWHAAGAQRLPAQALAVWQALAPPGASAPAWPVDAAGRVAPRFAAPPAALPTLGFAQVVRAALGQAPGQALGQGLGQGLGPALRGQVVFVGSSALQAQPVMTLQGQMQGTAVLAQSYAALRDGQLLRPAAAWARALLLALALLPALATCWRGRAEARRDALAAAAALLLVLAAVWGLALGAQMPVPLTAALVCLASGLLLSLLLHQRGLRQLHRRLVEERAQEAAANQAKSAFLANVSHEIRTPMNALLGVAELLAETPLNPQQQRHVQVFREAGQTLHGLINDLLDIAKIEAGHLVLDERPFSLHGLLHSQLALHRPRAQQKGLQLTLELAPGVPDTVHGDPQRLAQALGNLLANAVKFTSRGGVALAVRPAPADGAMALCFEVSDTGLGIAPSKLASIFDPFVQADGSVTRHHGGTGLGLAITRSIATLMSGHVTVRSQPALGSVFCLTVQLPPAALPAVALPAAAPALPAAALPAAGGGPRVLLAEDNAVNVHVFLAMLGPHCAVLDVASNGPMALELACSHAHDLVFMDWQMPGMDGLSVTRALRRHEAVHGLPRLPVVALTANAYAADRAQSAEAGCDEHIAKPASKAALLAALARHVPAGHAPPAMAAAATAAPAAGLHPGPLDTQAALARLGHDQALLDRVLDHAAVFILRWPQAFDAARGQGDTGTALRLVHDLRSIAASIGADALSAAAARLEAAMRSPADSSATEAAQQQLQCDIGPVILVLSRRQAG